MKHITKTIRILSLVSLFTDVASEMLYPIMPVYLKSIGFSILLIGVLEGLAEAIAGLSKGYFGKMSDNMGRRAPFVQLGYAFSAISKPMMAVFVFPAWIFLARTVDRFGKGIRTGARDAILSDESTPETMGMVFGFHRALDTFGAVLGPAIALFYLWKFPEDYKTLFFLAFIPGVVSVVLTFLIKDKKKPNVERKKVGSFFSFIHYWKESPPKYRKVVSGLLLFALFNSSDVFLLLKAKESGLSDAMVIGVYIFYNLIYAIFSLPAGMLADKIGLKSMLVAGLLIFVVVYSLIGFISSLSGFMILFALYGIYAASTEGISKALISNISDKKDTATAIGTYSGFQSICTLIASSVAGFVWYEFGFIYTFVSAAVVTLFVAFYFIYSIRDTRATTS